MTGLTDITEHLEIEAQLIVDRGVITRGQRLVVRNLLLEAKDKIEFLRETLAELDDESRRWKAEASHVIDEWEDTWERAGKPGRLGESRAKSVAGLIERLAVECEAWMNGVADVVEPLGYDREAASGPADLLPGLTELRNHDMENARRLAECVEARSYLYEQVVDLSDRLDEAKRIAEPDPQPRTPDEPDQDAHSFMRQTGSNVCVCGELIGHESHVTHILNPFDEHTKIWEEEIRGIGLNPDHVKKIAAKAKPYMDIPFGDVRGLPSFDPEALEEVGRFYENHGREMQ